MRDLILGVVAVAATIGVVYGSYWVAKTVSYNIFYEDMVQETIREMVKKEALKGVR